MSLKRILLVPDAHVPYHDTRAWSLMLKVGHALKFDTVVCLGDLIDNYAISHYEKDPSRALDWQWEIDSAAGAAKELEKLAPRRVFCEGNHEVRIRSWLARACPEDNRRSINSTVGVLDLGTRWKFVPYRDAYRLGKLWLSHDVERAGKHAAYQSLSDVGGNIAFGHTHRMAVVYDGSVTGERHVSAMLGWLGDVDQIDYRHKLRARREWQLGFGIAYQDHRGNVHVQAIPIVNYQCVVEGKLYGSHAVESAA